MSNATADCLPLSEKTVPYPDDSKQDLSRQISVQLTNQQFERLYLQPGGVGAPRQEDFTKRFGNPTPLGLTAFCICLSPMTCYLMGFLGTDASSLAAVAGPYLFTGGIGLYLASIMEWIIGNTFPSVVFAAYGGFTLSIGYLESPSQGIAKHLGGESVQYNGGLSLWFVFWAVITFIFMVSALRTNVVFLGLFFFLELLFIFLAVGYSNLGKGNVEQGGRILIAGGAFGFASAMCGWYLLLSVMLATNGLPTIPVGDMSAFMSRKLRC